MKVSKVNDFLSEAGVFFLATADGDQPKVRPLGAHMEMDGKVLFGIGDFKDVYKQMVANPKVEICGFSKGTWIRIAGKMKEDDRVEAKKSMLDNYPSLRAMYDENDDNTLVLYFTSAQVTFSSFTAPPETFEI